MQFGFKIFIDIPDDLTEELIKSLPILVKEFVNTKIAECREENQQKEKSVL